MSRFQLLFKTAQLLRLFYHHSGLLLLDYDRPLQRFYRSRNCCQGLRLLFILLVIAMKNLLYVGEQERWDMLIDHEIFGETFRDVVYLLLMLWALARRRLLWSVVNKAQLIHKQLQPLLDVSLKCSLLLLAIYLLLLTLLLALCARCCWYNWPHIVENDETNINSIFSYIMGFIQIWFFLVLSLHTFYHLLHAALLQSLNGLLQDDKALVQQLKLLAQWLGAQPLLKHMNHSAACYFKAYYGYHLAMALLKCYAFMAAISFTADDIVELQKSQDDIIDEADWAGIAATTTRGQIQQEAALELAWHLTIPLLLLGAAHAQQREHQMLIDSIWQLDFMEADSSADAQMADTSEIATPIRRCIPKRNILTFLLNTRMSIVDFRNSSVTFVAWKTKSRNCIISLDVAIGSFKLLLHLVLGSAAVVYIQQFQLVNLVTQLKAHSQ